MENLLFNLFTSGIIAFVISEAITLVYNVIIGIQYGIKITKEKKYKTVTATRITNNGQYERDELHEDRKKYVLKYEWTVDGKTYRRTIVTSAWPLPVDTFYYLNNPKYAMPLPEELSKFKHTKALFLISFLIAFIFMLNK